MMASSAIDRIWEIRPRSFVYLFSGGKDSAAALALTRNVVREIVEELKAKVYILYVYVTGNTHPLNAYCASKVMYWHREHYGFEPVLRARNKVFQEYMAKYGLMIGPQRWCYLEFKEKVFREFHRILPRPVLYIDGMKPSDSKHRKEMITEELQYIRAYSREYWSWHPLFSYSHDDVFSILSKYEEFDCVLRLYEVFGDSLNCIVCPYRSNSKLVKYHLAEDLSIVYDFMKQTMRSLRWLKLYSFAKNKTLVLSKDG